mmetsp:Transcript_1137/g.1597  ORF Transcript_1137/g.1597 Transcript_1137/m.1597 type:complete len:127 (-) Transcript_1137:192-572(-)|eukprot:CAMPEP_0206447688 /NCGR_PEP_ID=MMETSP0324_2-20121206/16972_1 /ASSEMBLY_ACC=CAM_ASM_000836 /TAXON_ID=2866 /ORGANISM="Crypthecodinium cohnii, Strain Seligo" /LENGTH=126 /DNA_ID=CAMNT_0053916581 /DNA_START=72 /DNA_END=452 /DNA_ORIENTATION=-
MALSKAATSSLRTGLRTGLRLIHTPVLSRPAKRAQAATTTLSSPLSQQLRFARELPEAEKYPRRVERLQEFRADKDRLHDNWAWVGWWEAKVERNEKQADRLCRKLNNCKLIDKVERREDMLAVKE